MSLLLSDRYGRRANRRTFAGILLMTLSSACVWSVGWSAVQQNAPLAIGSAIVGVLAFFGGSIAFDRSRYWSHRAAQESRFATIETLSSPIYSDPEKP